MGFLSGLASWSRPSNLLGCALRMEWLGLLCLDTMTTCIGPWSNHMVRGLPRCPSKCYSNRFGNQRLYGPEDTDKGDHGKIDKLICTAICHFHNQQHPEQEPHIQCTRNRWTNNRSNHDDARSPYEQVRQALPELGNISSAYGMASWIS